jgi:adenylylsulfate kinase-like enzyme
MPITRAISNGSALAVSMRASYCAAGRDKLTASTSQTLRSSTASSTALCGGHRIRTRLCHVSSLTRSHRREALRRVRSAMAAAPARLESALQVRRRERIEVALLLSYR